jgi:hypothetical protein
VNIRLTETSDGWNLWAAATADATAAPVYTAHNRTPEQIAALLPAILGETPPPRPVIERTSPPKTAAMPDQAALQAVVAAAMPPQAMGKVGAAAALQAMLMTLDSWIEGAYENHHALEHRSENTGEECWREFAPSDIRAMVNDTARDLGLTEFRLDGVGKEDRVAA